MRIPVTPADQAVARLDVMLAEQLGEDVDPRVKVIAEADLSLTSEGRKGALPDHPSKDVVFLDDETGEIVAVGVDHPAVAHSPGTSRGQSAGSWITAYVEQRDPAKETERRL